MEVKSTLIFDGAAKITGLPSPVNASDAANKGYVDAAIEGMNWKDNVRVATASNINLALGGASIDGVTMATNDRVLVKAQTDQTQNGIYIYTGAASPLTRSNDANTLDELKNAIVAVDEGTAAGTTWRQTTVTGTIGTANIIFESFANATPQATDTSFGTVRLATSAEVSSGTGAGVLSAGQAASLPSAYRTFNAVFGDGTATSYTITHNLNTFDVKVEIVRNSGNRDTVLANVERTTVNSVTITTDAPVAANAFKALVSI